MVVEALGSRLTGLIGKVTQKGRRGKEESERKKASSLAKGRIMRTNRTRAHEEEDIDH